MSHLPWRSASRLLFVRCVYPSICLAALLAAAGGCTKEPDKFIEAPVKANLRQISRAYGTHYGYYNQPPNAEELRIVVDDMSKLDQGVPADEALVSPRDGQPYVIVYGAGVADPTNAIFAYEKQGADGTRWVLTLSQDIKELTNEQFKKALFAKNHKPEGI